MKKELQNMAGVSLSEMSSLKKDNKVTSADYIKKMSGINEGTDDITINEKRDIDKIYLKLLEKFEDDTDTINSIKEVFSNVHIKGE